MDEIGGQRTKDLCKDLTILSRCGSQQRVRSLRQRVGYKPIFVRMSRIIIGGGWWAHSIGDFELRVIGVFRRNKTEMFYIMVAH